MMVVILKGEKLSIEELENLSYYDFMGYLNVPFFNCGGLSSMDRLVELCEIDKRKKILVVGCGTGVNSIYLTKNFDCSIVGIDIAEKMVEKAKENAEKENIADKIEFKVGNAYNLDCEDLSFDVVLLIFVAQFLNLEIAFKEFYRVLKSGGYLGVNEMYKYDEIPETLAKKIKESEAIFQELTELPFTLYTPSYWKKSFENALFSDVKLEEYQDITQRGSMKRIIKDIGGYKKFTKILFEVLIYALKSKKLRKKFSLISKAKRTFLRNKETSKYVGYILCVGKKP